jgi:hypothetical protein
MFAEMHRLWSMAKRHRNRLRHRAAAMRSLCVEPLELRSMLSGSSLFWDLTADPEGAGPAAAIARAVPPTVSIVATDATAAETSAGAAADTGLFTISRTGAAASSLRVRFSVSGTATNGVDYSSLTTTVRIPSRRSTVTVRVTPLDDVRAEGTEHVTLTIAASTAYRIDAVKPAATVSIADNDVQDPRIAALVAEVQQSNSTPVSDSYEDFFTLLPVNQGARRGYEQGQALPDLLRARTAIFSALDDALSPVGGTVQYQDFTVGGYAGRNIVGILPGQGPNKAEQYVITAHYDSEQNAGADDNASGVAGMLEAARVLARHRFNATLVFVATDQEEERSNGWGVGSDVYAGIAKSSDADLRGAIVLDMIAYNHSGANTAIVGQSDSSSTSPSAALVGQIRQAFALYTNVSTTRGTGFNDTDAYRFHQSGFTAATLIEQLDRAGYPLNPYYHDTSDYYRNAAGQLQQYNGRNYLDLAYATQMTRGTVAWAATAAGLFDPIVAAQTSVAVPANRLNSTWSFGAPSFRAASSAPLDVSMGLPAPRMLGDGVWPFASGRDEPRLLPRTCFSIEPGIYLEGRFGVREVNDYAGRPAQTANVSVTAEPVPSAVSCSDVTDHSRSRSLEPNSLGDLGGMPSAWGRHAHAKPRAWHTLLK